MWVRVRARGEGVGVGEGEVVGVGEGEGEGPQPRCTSRAIACQALGAFELIRLGDVDVA